MSLVRELWAEVWHLTHEALPPPERHDKYGCDELHLEILARGDEPGAADLAATLAELDGQIAQLRTHANAGGDASSDAAYWDFMAENIEPVYRAVAMLRRRKGEAPPYYPWIGTRSAEEAESLVRDEREELEAIKEHASREVGFVKGVGAKLRGLANVLVGGPPSTPPEDLPS